MKYIKVKPNTNGDSRVANKVPTFEEFSAANRDHRKDVQALMESFAESLKTQGEEHDWTKVREPYRSMFYRDLCNTIEGRMEFMDGEWAKLHYEQMERHHLKRHCPEDVNLFDVIEMLCDCVCAGMARSGDVYDVDIPPEILVEAVKNTVELLKEHTIVEEQRT